MQEVKTDAEEYAARHGEARRNRAKRPMEPVWTDGDNYFCGLLAPSDEALDRVLEANTKAGLPPIDVSRLQGKFLVVLAQLMRAQRILEVGTLGGYSTICMARALPPEGCIVTLEFNPRHAQVARENLRNAGVHDRVELREGRAAESMAALAAEGAEPFDLIFIDADKENNALYFEWAMKLSHPGSAIVVDNVVRDGRIVEEKSRDVDVQGTQRMFEAMAAEPRVSATVLQTVGAKGYDGFALAVVLR